MKKALLDKDGNVVNIIVVGPGYKPPPGLAVASATGKTKAGRWDGKKLVLVPAAAPDPDKLKNAAIAAATTLDELKAALLGQTE